VPSRRVTRALLGGVPLAVAITLCPGPVPAGAADADAALCVAPPVAHRGASTAAPENTIPAFRAALQAGVTQLDLDVRFTASGVPVLMHDKRVNRTTDGTGRLSAMSLEQVRALDAGSWFSSEFVGTRVPTLYQALKFTGTRGARLQVELKVRPTDQQADDVLNRIRWLGMLKRVRVISFDEATIDLLRAKEPALQTAIIDRASEARSADAVLRYGSTYVVNYWSVTAARAESWRAAGIEVRPWTVNTVKGWRRMAFDDAGPVITNRPVAYLSWARSFCS
jgi:glycerophosphoryl diester phosphodiesterase